MIEMKPLSELGVVVLDCDHSTPVARESGHPYIAIPDIQGGRVVLETCRRISSEDLARWTARTKPLAGDVIVTRRARVGDTAPIPPKVDCAIGQNLVLLRSVGGQVDQTFLRWATKGPLWQAEIERFMNVGAIFSSLNVRDIGEMRIPVFPLPEQQAIAEVLGALDDKIAANACLMGRVRALVQATFTQCTAGQQLQPLSSVAEINSNSIEPAVGKFRYIDIASVADGEYAKPVQLDWRDAPSRARRGVQFGDTLWSTVRPNLRAHALVLENSEGLVASTGFATITPKYGDFAFVFAATDTPGFVDHLVSHATGSAYPAVSAAALAAAPVPQVDKERRAAFERFAAPLLRFSASASGESRTLASLRDTLLPALMSGRLRVRDAEKQVEEAL